MEAPRSRSAVPAAQLRIVLQESGNLCAFPSCNRILTVNTEDGSLAVGEVAHIIGASRQGPRGDDSSSLDERSVAANLILLCEEHHKIIDRFPRIYSTPVLRRMKEDHCRRVAERLRMPARSVPTVHVDEVLQSSLMPVTHMPQRIYAAPLRDDADGPAEIGKALVYPKSPAERVVFILRERRLFTFHDLREYEGPFTNAVLPNETEELDAETFLASPDMARWYVELLNRALASHCRYRHLRYDKEHKRHYFPPERDGSTRKIWYKTAAGQRRPRNVAWNPKRRATGEGKNHWLHRGVRLRFEQFAANQWVLSIRPEWHLTIDGRTLLTGKAVGPRVTRIKSRVFNWQYLAEVNFWQEFLSDGSPNLIVRASDKQAVVASAALVRVAINWPGIPGDVKHFDATQEDHNLFSLAELDAALGEFDPDDDEGVEFYDEDEDFDE